MSGNILFHVTLCLVGVKNAHAFHVAGDCQDLLEGRSSWEGGDSWDIRAATMGSPDWNLLLEFDRPLQGLQVFNGAMETEDMKQFKIAPEKYLRHHKAPVDVNFLVNYGAGHPPAKLEYINVNGKTLFCKDGLGELSGNPRSGRVTGQPPQFRDAAVETVPLELALANADFSADTTSTGTKTAKSKSVVSCTQAASASSPASCTKTNTLTFEIPGFTCPADVMPAACEMLGAGTTVNTEKVCEKTDTATFMKKFCYHTCFCKYTTT